MDPLSADIRKVEPTAPSVASLIATHLKLMRASSPACSVHAMEPGDLAEADASFFAAFAPDGETLAIGALKVINNDHGELKSMHVRAADRGRGLADAMLAHLIENARQIGLSRVSLETGSQDAFAPARAFYKRHGFNQCPRSRATNPTRIPFL